MGRRSSLFARADARQGTAEEEGVVPLGPRLVADNVEVEVEERPAESEEAVEPRGPEIAPPAEAARPAAARPRHRRWLSPLTYRILMLNALTIAIPVFGLMYLDEYRQNLVQTELNALRTEGELFAGALAASGVVFGPRGDEKLLPETTRHIVRRLVDISKNRARLFGPDGTLLADSFGLVGAGGQVEVQSLPPLRPLFSDIVNDLYERVRSWLPRAVSPPVYHESAVQKASDYPEAVRALSGEIASFVRDDGAGGMVLTVAVPVQRYRQVLGALMLSTNGKKIDDTIRSVRLDILKVFGVTLLITTVVSLWLAGTIARPIRRLAAAAERVRYGQGRQTAIPDFSHRRDEIGDLSRALSDMTAALWHRVDAVERFAADVAHEIKNPLSSLRSAVETVSRIEDPERKRKLMGIITEDVQRLDRLISDISDASRLDAELSRSEAEPVDVGKMVAALAEVHQATAAPGAPRLELAIARNQELRVLGIESRLVQVLRNVILNAASFSPPDGVIHLGVVRDGARVRLSVADQGPGIPPSKLTAVFDRFYSERPKNEKFGTHSGLGLSISKQIVEAHGGTISAENRQDRHGRIRGARFVISLPAE